MKLNELVITQKIIVQVNLGEQVIEFYADVLDLNEDGITVTPYVHNDEVLELSIDAHHSIMCNIYADDLANNRRISWKNVKVQTVDTNNGKAYYISTSAFNRHSREDDNRQHNRLLVHKNAHILEEDKFIDIIVHDISDRGISFYAPPSYKPTSNHLTIVFADNIDEKDFDLKIACQIARTERKAGVVFYGCKVLGDNKEFLSYGFLKRLKRRHP